MQFEVLNINVRLLNESEIESLTEPWRKRN